MYRDRLTEEIERLAHHAVRTEEWDKVHTYCRQAGAKVVVQAAYRGTVAVFEQALEALQYLPLLPA